MKDELGGIKASGDGGGGNSGEVEQAGGGLRAWAGGVGGSGGGAGHSGVVGGRGAGKGGGGLRGVLGAEEEKTGSGGAGGSGFLRESDVLEEREVDDEDIDTDEMREDFLSGTLGLGRFPEGDMERTKEGTGVPAVGVLDWLE